MELGGFSITLVERRKPPQSHGGFPELSMMLDTVGVRAFAHCERFDASVAKVKKSLKVGCVYSGSFNRSVKEFWVMRSLDN